MRQGYLGTFIRNNLPENINDLGTKRLSNALFSFRIKLLNTAKENELFLQEIFDKRDQILDLFLHFKIEATENLVKTFRDANRPEDLLEDFEIKVRKAPKSPCKTGLLIFGPELSKDQFRAIVDHRVLQEEGKPDRRVTSPVPKTMLQLLRLKKSERRNIVITAPRDEKLDTQLQYLTYIRPDLLERIYFLRWEEEKPVLDKFQPDSTPMSRPQQQAALFVHRFIEHRPEVGEIFQGVIKFVSSKDVFYVEILPGVEGLVNCLYEDPAYLEDLSIEEGQLVTVKVIEIDINGYLQLSISAAADDIFEKKAKPVFQLEDFGLNLLQANF